MPRLRCLAVLTALALAAPAGAATARRTLDAYALFATEALRARGLTVAGGDLGVPGGTLRSAGPLEAPASQIVARVARLANGSRCGGLLADRVAATGPGCVLAGPAGAVIDDVPRACGFPSPLPGCDRARRVVVSPDAPPLGAGVYGDVVVSGGRRAATLELLGGHYVFCTLRLRRGARVVADAPVRVDVTGSLRVESKAVVGPAPGVALGAADVRLFAGGSRVRFLRGAEVTARLCAPESRLGLAGATVRGTFVARRIRAAQAAASAPYAEVREPCAAYDPLRNAYFGDLHVHTTLSFDAHAFDVPTTPLQAYRFAQGDPVVLPPLDAGGQGTQTLRLERPLDFTALTDHSEFLGEVEACTTPGSSAYDAPSCQLYRAGGNGAVSLMGIRLGLQPPMRLADVCGADGQFCLSRASEVWRRVQDAAEGAYDRSAACAFTSFVGYEFSATQSVSTLHRNVIFRNDRVPFPISFFEQPTPEGLWTALRAACLEDGSGCDVLAIPHNSNESNGRMFTAPPDLAPAAAAFRASIEPLVEIYQHKGDSECSNGLSGVVGAPDEQCEFEKRRRLPFDDCGEGTGGLGTITGGCVSRRDFVRGVLLAGLQETERIGVNPYRLGVVGSTDTHNGTPGAVEEDAFIGHRGTDDDTVAKQLGPGELYPGGILFSPGGLAGAWAEENSRPSLFDAFRRRETFGTSGPRITVRFFGGWDLPRGLCDDADMVRTAYALAAPMGGFLGPPPATGAPTFLVAALRDPGTPARPGAPLQRLQIVKGWLESGEAHQAVYDVAGNAANGASVDESTCATSGSGADSLCAVWIDPAFVAGQQAFYYARVLENPSCRWSTWICNRVPPAERPPSCSDPAVPRTIQERAWTSPIWYQPTA